MFTEMQKQLEQKVAATAAIVADWRTKIAKIEAQIAAENHAIMIATKHREQHALAATLGESNAIAAIKKARSDQYEAEQRGAVARDERVPALESAAGGNHGHEGGVKTLGCANPWRRGPRPQRPADSTVPLGFNCRRAGGFCMSLARRSFWIGEHQ
jgi:ParB-like chromosome segregation protein Spo0J